MDLINIKHNLTSNDIYNNIITIINQTQEDNNYGYFYNLKILKLFIIDFINSLQKNNIKVNYTINKENTRLYFEWGHINLFYHHTFKLSYLSFNIIFYFIDDKIEIRKIKNDRVIYSTNMTDYNNIINRINNLIDTN